MSRVTPAQATLLSFENDRYTPLRPIGDANTVAAAVAASKEKEAGSKKPSANSSAAQANVIRLAGGSIVLLRDNKPEEEGKYVELDKSLWPADVPEATPVPAAPEQTQGEAVAEEDEAEVPPAFEYPFDD